MHDRGFASLATMQLSGGAYDVTRGKTAEGRGKEAGQDGGGGGATRLTTRGG